MLLSNALGQLLGETGEEQGMTIEEAWRITLALTADLFSVFLHAGEMPPEEVDAIIDSYFCNALTNYLRRPPQAFH